MQDSGMSVDKNVILVTGSSGFIGTNLCKMLKKSGNCVVGVDIVSPINPESVSEFHNKDICNIDWNEINLTRVSSIVHLAAKISVPESIKFPEKYHRVNVIATEKLFQAAAEHQVENVVFASSAACYGDSIEDVKRVGEEGNLNSPYAESKLQGELLANKYALPKTKFICFRFFNVYGPGQSPHSEYSSVIPLFLDQAINNKNLTIHGDGAQTRDFVNVSDICKTIINSFSADLKPFNVINIGTGEGISIISLARSIINAVISSNISTVSQVITGPSRAGDVLHSTADITELEKVNSTSNFISLNKGLKELTETFIKSRSN